MNDTAQNVLAQAVAKDDAKLIAKTFIGYAVTLLMDYGNGRQVTIAGTLPLDATKEQFDAELDKLRLSTNRQQAFVILRDREARLAAEEKMVLSLKHMMESYTKDADVEIEKLSKGDTGKMTITKQEIRNMRQQVLNYTQAKKEELSRHETEVDICKVIIAGCKKEIEG